MHLHFADRIFWLWCGGVLVSECVCVVCVCVCVCVVCECVFE